jgi:Nanos RNA binding domain
MSRNFKNVSTKKPYCKFCHDIGKSEQEYTNHWVKDQTGKIVCPTLLSTECRFCFKMGHTTKFCDVLANQNKQKNRVQYNDQKIQKNENIISSNRFQSLEEQNVAAANLFCMEEFPALIKSVTSKPSAITQDTKCWAEIAAKPKVIEEKKAPEYSVTTKKYNFSFDGKKTHDLNWADYSDTDYDDEEDFDRNDNYNNNEELCSSGELYDNDYYY